MVIIIQVLPRSKTKQIDISFPIHFKRNIVLIETYIFTDCQRKPLSTRLK